MDYYSMLGDDLAVLLPGQQHHGSCLTAPSTCMYAQMFNTVLLHVCMLKCSILYWYMYMYVCSVLYQYLCVFNTYVFNTGSVQ